MDRNLDEIVAADEELRARIGSAERAARERVEAAKAARERRARERAAAAAAKLEAELRAAATALEAQVEERRRCRAEWIAGREKTAESLLPGAAEAWAEIVRSGEPR